MDYRKNENTKSEITEVSIKSNTDNEIYKESFISDLQQRLWILNQLDKDYTAYNFPIVINLTGQLNYAAIEKSVYEIVRRHESLRSEFYEKDYKIIQRIRLSSSVKLKFIDFYKINDQNNESSINNYIMNEVNYKFDLSKGPLFNISLIKIEENRHILVLVCSLIIFDEWSKDIFLNEFVEFYKCFVSEKEPSLQELSLNYSDYAAKQKELIENGIFDKQLTYWKNKLIDGEFNLELQTDYCRPPLQSYKGRKHPIKLSDNTVNRIKRLADSEQCTLFMYLLTVFQILLHKYTNQDSINTGTPIACRNNSEVEKIIGLFINTLIIKTDFSKELSFKQLLRDVRKTVMEAFDNQDISVDKIIEALDCRRDMSRQALFQTMFIFHHFPSKKIYIEGLEMEMLDYNNSTSKFDITLELFYEDGVINGWFEYNTDLFSHETIELMSGHYDNLLSSTLNLPDEKVTELSMISHWEYNKIIEDWNNTSCDYDKETSLIGLFNERVKLNPQGIAIIYNGENWTYDKLNRYSNKIACFLNEQNNIKKAPVAFIMQRSPITVATIIGILKAGGLYVPIDKSYPQKYIEAVLEDVEPSIIFTDSDLDISCMDRYKERFVQLDDELKSLSRESDDINYDLNINEAYIMYTSGSTGAPKGVIGLQKAIINRCNWMWNTYPFAEDDICCHKTSLCFVDSVCEIFSPLLKGVPFVIIPNKVLLDINKLLEFLGANKITRITLVPTLMNIIVDEYENLKDMVPNLRIWVSSGEPLSISLCRKFKDRLPEAILINLYGSTETAGDSTYYDTRNIGESTSRVPIGRPIHNTGIYILDKNSKPVPIGVIGEIYISGDGLAKGYYRRPEMNEKKFLTVNFHKGICRHLYKTGDYGRYLPDGNIEYHGRVDRQVKIRGIRIEVESIEAVLKDHEDIKNAVVKVYSDNHYDDKLVAYIIMKNDHKNIDGLKKYIRDKLPEHYVPDFIIKMDDFPMLSNGKMDMLNFPRPDKKEVTSEIQHPATEIEKDITTIWGGILGIDLGKIDIYTNFFDLGGHSLTAAHLLSRINQKYDMNISLKDLFKYSNIHELAAHIELELSTSNDWLYELMQEMN